MRTRCSTHLPGKRRRKNRRFRSRPLCLTEQGFTLFEVMLAFFIFSVLFITIYASYSGSFKTISITESRMEMYRKAATALERISEDLQGSYISVLPTNSFGLPAAYTRFLGEESAVNGQDAHSLSFYSRIPPLFSLEDAPVTGQLVAYSVTGGSETDELLLLRSEYSEFIEEFEDRGGLVLADGLQSVTFAYMDDAGELYENWDSDADEFKGVLPRMVNVSLQFINPENPDAPLTFVTSVAIPSDYEPKSPGGGQG
jgi:general secretion pathway protein J